MMRYTKLSEWLAWLENLHALPIDMREGRLDLLRKIATKLHLLPSARPSVTVAGTNGKGSTVAGLESILMAAGYRVGAYTSPHLLNYNERIRIQGQAVDDAALCAAFQQIDTACGQETLSFFEFGTLVALLLFTEADVDIQLLEVGMGGRLDAVNMIDADIAIITTISLDHTQWLGQDREAIGREKAGIMRPHRPVLFAGEALPASIRQHAKEITAVLHCQGQDFGYVRESETWSWWSAEQQISNLPLPSLELQNMSAVLQALECLKALGRPVSEEAIIQGLQRVSLPGRFQIFEGKVQRILDVAHNPESMQLLAKRLAATPCVGRTLAVVGMLQDKDKAGSLVSLLPAMDDWYVADLAGARGEPAATLIAVLEELGVKKTIQSFVSVIAAYETALSQAKTGDRIVVFGSFHTVAPVLAKEIAH